MRALRGACPLALNAAFASPFDVVPLCRREPQYAAIHVKDREAFHHSVALYAVWSAKPWLLDAALDAARRAGNATLDFGATRGAFGRNPARVCEVFGPPTSRYSSRSQACTSLRVRELSRTAQKGPWG